VNKNICISILIIIISCIVILNGCGGGNEGGTISPASIPTQSNNETVIPEDINNQTEEYGSIVIKVTWPEEEGASPKCIISSGDEEKDITASMPVDIMRLEVKIFDKNDLTKPLDPPGIKPIYFTAPGQTVIETIEPIPLIPVLIRVEAYNAPYTGGNIISFAEVELEIHAGSNSVTLNMGSYYLSLSADPAVLKVIPDFKSVLYKVVDETTVTATLSVPKPSSNPYPTPIPAAGRRVKFEIERQNAFFLADDGITSLGYECEKYTGSDGKCSVKVKINYDSPDFDKNITVLAKFWGADAGPTDEPDIIRSKIITVNHPLIWEEGFNGEIVANAYCSFYGLSRADRRDPNNPYNSINNLDHIIKCEGETSLRLYGVEQDIYGPDGNFWYGTGNEHARSTVCRTISWYNSYSSPYLKIEVRAKIRNSDDPIGHSGFPEYEGYPYSRGIIGFSGGSIINFLWLSKNMEMIRFEEDNNIYAIRGSSASEWKARASIYSYSSHVWYSARIQVIEVSNKTYNIYYWIEDKDGVTLREYEQTGIYYQPDLTDLYLTLQAAAGTVWFDDIKVYKLTGLPSK